MFGEAAQNIRNIFANKQGNGDGGEDEDDGAGEELYSEEHNIFSPVRRIKKKSQKKKKAKRRLTKSTNNFGEESEISEVNWQESDFISRSNPAPKLSRPKKSKKKKKMTAKEKKRLKKLKKLKIKRLREKKKKEKKQRMKKRLKAMLQKFLKENPWKNKNMFKGRLKAMKEFRRRGTLPGVRLAERCEPSGCNRHNHEHNPVLHEKEIKRTHTLLGRGGTMHNIRDPVFHRKTRLVRGTG